MSQKEGEKMSFPPASSSTSSSSSSSSSSARLVSELDAESKGESSTKSQVNKKPRTDTSDESSDESLPSAQAMQVDTDQPISFSSTQVPTYTGIVASSTSTSDSQVNILSTVAPQKLDLSQLPKAAQDIFKEKWASSELQDIVHLKISNMPRLNSQPEQFWNAIEKLSYAEIQLFNDLKTVEDISAAFGSRCGLSVEVNKPFFFNIANAILQIQPKDSLETISTFYGTIASSSNPQDTQSNSFFPDLYFVNRLDSMNLAFEVYAHNNNLNGINKPILLVAPQMFGSGKTAFFRRLCAGKITPDNPSGNPYYDQILRDPNDRELKKSVLDSQYVLINFEDFSPATNDITHDIFNIIDGRVKEEIPEARASPCPGPLKKSWLKSLQEKLGKPIFLHFDEIGIVEFRKFDPWFSGDSTYKRIVNSKPEGDDSLEARLYRQYQLWRAIFPLLTLLNVFVGFSGKTDAVGLLNSGLLSNLLPGLSISSPGGVKYLFFDPLGVKHIREIVRNHTPLKGLPTKLNEDLQLQDDNLDYGKIFEDFGFDPKVNQLEDLPLEDLKKKADQITLFCYVLRDFTGGIPRFISYTLSFIWSNRATLNLREQTTLEAMEQFFQNEGLKLLIASLTRSFPFEGLLKSNDSVTDASLALINKVILGAPFQEDQKMVLRSQKEITIVSFLTRYNCYTSKAVNKPGKLQAVIPGCLRESVFYNFTLPYLTLQGAQQLSTTGEGYEKVIGFGFLHSLYLLSHNINSEVALGQRCKFPNWIENELKKLLAIPSSSTSSSTSLTLNKLLPLVLIESQKLTERTVLVKHDAATSTSKVFNALGFHNHLANKFNNNKLGNTIFIWFQPQSQSPDVLIAIKKNGVDQVQSSDDYFLIGIATKVYLPTTKDYFKRFKVQDEVEKWKKILLPGRTTLSLLFCYSNRFYSTDPNAPGVPLDVFSDIPLPDDTTEIKENNDNEETERSDEVSNIENTSASSEVGDGNTIDVISTIEIGSKYACSSDHSFLGSVVSSLIQSYGSS